MGLSCFACFDGGSKQQRREEERLASAEARAKAAEAAQKRRTSSKVADELKLKPVLDVAAVLIECFQPCSSFIGFDHMVNFTGFSPSDGTFFARYVFC
ncbi:TRANSMEMBRANE PROTEIN [Salix koriyanagi]|uniref:TRANSMEMBRANE PROTEIN n=1 Tax=Salix koriyanagi TaxID=2511006 RepID=A0A9Q0YST2_9ROSI|nr:TRANSMEMBRANE PROTEIN [Salix koriyanagi]